jgi:hypothetical protein
VLIKLWNPSAQRAREAGLYSGEAKRINKKLDLIEAKLRNYIADNHDVSKEDLKAHLNSARSMTAKKGAINHVY